ncbi:phosphatidylglycerophosphatase A family protein [Orenia marismortui]|uniref:phosphatidylglycerophosphatase A family protein n=1 Tax=Orenia marismortui TaxID=46469 RepID=UPI000377CCDA|nr:phosphatidylglycerophosphatase A [Orenia marismortui]
MRGWNRDKVIKFLATGFYSGLSPYAPGTVGTFLGMILLWISFKLGMGRVYFPLIFIVTLAGTYLSHHAENIYDEKDAPQIVVDEFAGLLVAMYGLSAGMLIPAFVLFRVFDILKPPPIRNLQEFHGGVGIMLDDILAGLIANILIRIVLVFA